MNRDEGDAHELCRSAGLLFPYLIWSEAGRKVVVDGEVDFRLSPSAMVARCSAGWGGGRR
jgi:hypothetical protein